MDEPAFEERLTAILAADAVGYSRLMALDQRATLAALDAARAVFHRRVDLHHGRVIDTAGDSVLATFATASGAVRAALECQQDIVAAAEGVPSERRMLFRIGVHLGDVIVKPDGTVYGTGVNVAARLQALAQPAGVCVSDAVCTAVRDQLAANFVDLGEHAVKNIPQPVRAYSVASEAPAHAADAATDPANSLALPDKPSIAVLPFANMSGDAEQEYFCDGITEDIITELSRFRSLFVIARNSTFTYKGKAVDVRTVARELGVRYVLEGSIRRGGQRIRVTAQLIDAASGAHVWAERYDRVVAEIFDVQEEVTRAIVAEIAPHIEISETERIRAARPQNLGIYELGLRAWSAAQAAFRQADARGADQAIALAREALAVDERCGHAWRSIAAAQLQHLLFNTATSPVHASGDGIEAATRAITIDGADEIAYAYRGMLVFAAARDPYSGLADLRRAHQLNPNNAFALAQLGMAEAFGGNAPAAVDYATRGVRLSPRDPLRYLMMASVGWAHFAGRQYEQSGAAARAALAEAPGYQPARSCLISSLVGLGQIDAARAEFERQRAMAPEYARRQFGDNPTMFFDPECRARRTLFMRIAAGLEPPPASATDSSA